MTAKRLPIDEMKDRVSGASIRVERLHAGLGLVERDMDVSAPGMENTYFCVDYHNLHGYLFSPLAIMKASTELSLATADLLVCFMLFDYLRARLVLLPNYYTEFRSTIEKGLVDVAAPREQSRLLLTRMRGQLDLALRDRKGLLTVLAQPMEDNPAGLEEARLRVEGTLVRLSDAFRSTADVIVAGERFDALVRTGRLIGLRRLEEVIGEVRFKEDTAYYAALNWFEKRRPSAAEANMHDAAALSYVHRLNSRSKAEGPWFYLFSSAETMRAAVRDLNEGPLAAFGETIELRDLEYWLLWFNCTEYSQGEWTPSSSRLQVLEQRIRPLLEHLKGQFRRLLVALGSLRRAGLERPPEDLEADVGVHLSRLDSIVGELVAPISDGRRLFAELSSGFSPVVEEFSGIMGRLRNALERLEGHRENWNEISTQLEALSTSMQRVILRSEAVSRQMLEEVSTLEGAFSTGFQLEREEPRQPFRELLEVIERDGRSAVGPVLERLGRLAAEELCEYDGLIVTSRVNILQGLGEEAWRSLMRIKEVDRVRPMYLLAMTLLHEIREESQEAEEVMARLLERYNEPFIWMAAANLWFERWRRTQDEECRARAKIWLSILGERQADGAWSAMRARAEVLMLWIRTGPELLAKPDELSKVIARAVELRARIVHDELGLAARDLVETLLANLRNEAAGSAQAEAPGRPKP